MDFLAFGKLGLKSPKDGDSTPAGTSDAILLENGDGLQMEDGFFILLE